MKIAIMGAMAEEIEPLLSHVTDIKKTEYAANIYYEANYKGKEVVIAYSKIGKVFASLTATILIEKFGCDRLLFSGVAGAIDPDLDIGDLVIAVPEGEVCIATDPYLRSVAKEVASKKDIKLKEGIIATGDQFVANVERKNWIAKIFDAHALEMEGASVAVVCNALNVPFFILRAISDSADMDAGFDFDKFLEGSAKVSADFILEMVDIIELTKSLSN